jgi:AraC-like DNA-binding protein
MPRFAARFLSMPTSRPASRRVRTYGMAERADHLDFDIRTQDSGTPLCAPHRHDYFQIKIGLAGEVEQMVGASVRPFARGYASFILPYRVHLVPHPLGARFVMINFSQRFLYPDWGIDALDLEDVDLARAPELAPFLYQEYLDFRFDEARFAQAEQLIAQMHAENAARGFGSLALIRGLLLQLIALACRQYEARITALHAAQGQHGSRRDALARLARYLREHLGEEIAVADAASAVHLSPNYLAHLLKKETGKTFTELLTERRMEHALDLLAHTSSRIDRIAQASGFADQAYFARRFKQRYGQSPRDYRSKLRGALEFGH